MSDDKNDRTTIAPDSDRYTPRVSKPQESQQPAIAQLSPRPRNYGSIEPAPSNRIDQSAPPPDKDEVEPHRVINETTTLAATPTSSSSGSSTPEDMKSTLSFLQKFGFGLGHVYNDLCAGVWFSYTLLFMQYVLGLPAVESGTLVMLGQVCDAIATPIVGVLADRYGTKRRWHIAGTCLVFFSFPMIFAMCPWCEIGYSWWPPVYFAIFIMLFQVAWAIVQISHFAMIPELSKTTKDRADLTATRYSASVIANLVVYLTMWLILKERTTDSSNIGPEDKRQFRDIALILTLVGLSMSVLFHFSLALSDYEHRRLMSLAATRDMTRDDSPVRKQRIPDEGHHKTRDGYTRLDSEHSVPTDSDENVNVYTQNRGDAPPERRRYMRQFLKSPLLYQNAFLYVFARLFMTTSLVYMPLWLDERAYKTDNDPLGPLDNASSAVEHLATVPLVCFMASFVSSMLLKHSNRWIPHGLAYLIGSGISISGCAWIAFASPKAASVIQLYTISVLFGSGSSITMVSSLCITADMIGRHTYQGGFIYSAVTFADKLITGIVVAIIEAVKCRQRTDCPTYYQSVLAYGCGLAAILGILTLWTLRCTSRRTYRSRYRNDTI